MKKTHIWNVLEIVQIRCPYCGHRNEYEGHFTCETDKLECYHCKRIFELGEQK